jgi:Na+/proline symporter
VFFWPILVIFIALVVHVVAQFVRQSDHASLRETRNALAAPLFFGASSIVIGFAGAGIELYRTLKLMAADPEKAAPLFSGVVLEVSSTIAIALLVALAAGVAWFVLAGKATRLEDKAARTFMEVK